LCSLSYSWTWWSNWSCCQYRALFASFWRGNSWDWCSHI